MEGRFYFLRRENFFSGEQGDWVLKQRLEERRNKERKPEKETCLGSCIFHKPRSPPTMSKVLWVL